jgi:hypothetical protein
MGYYASKSRENRFQVEFYDSIKRLSGILDECKLQRKPLIALVVPWCPAHAENKNMGDTP